MPSRAADNALSFTAATSQYVAVPGFGNIAPTSEVTVEFWAKANSVRAQSAFILSPDSTANRFQAHVNYNISANGREIWDFGNISGGGRVIYSNPSTINGAWKHFAFVSSQSASSMKIYVDGVQVASSGAAGAFTQTAAELRIGGSTGLFFDGAIDDFRVWKAARSPQDIQADMGRVLTGSEPGLLLYFPFDETSGSTAVNKATATGAAYNGTLTNSPTRVAGPITNYVVNSNASNGSGTLRRALSDALAAAGRALITFDPAVFTGATPSTNVIALTTNELSMTDPDGVTIDGSNIPGGVTVSGENGRRILNIGAAGNLTVKGLTFAKANSLNAAGGAILNKGKLTLTDSTFIGNTSGTDGGGAIKTETASAVLTMNQCTVTGNTAGFGGGIWHNSGILSLNHCTIVNNTGSDGSGGLVAEFGATYLTNSIIAGNISGTNVDPDIGGAGSTFVLSGTNLIGIGGSDSGYSTQLPVGSPNPQGNFAGTLAAPVLAKLGPLVNNGGPTATMLPLPGSLARDRIASSLFTTDQRGLGFPRIAWGAADIGAAESSTLQADFTWEVREYISGDAAQPLERISDVENMIAAPTTTEVVSTAQVINFDDTDAPAVAQSLHGYFINDRVFASNNRTPQGLIDNNDNDFAMIARAYITITAEDDYTFGFSSDDGARLRLFSSNGGADPVFMSSTRLNPDNPADPAHSGNTLSFDDRSSNSDTLGVAHLTPGVYGVEFLSWEDAFGASAEVFAARGAKTTIDGSFRLLGDIRSPIPLGHGTLAASGWTVDAVRQGANDMGAVINQLTQLWTLRPVTQLRFLSANDFDDRDPMTFTLEGANSPTGPWTAIASGNTSVPSARNARGPIVSFNNTVHYSSYRLTFPTLRNSTTANAMQIGEVEFLDADGNDLSSSFDDVTAFPTNTSESPATEGVAKAIDDTPAKYLNFNKNSPGLIVTIPGPMPNTTAVTNVATIAYTDPQNGGTGSHGATFLPFPGNLAGDDDDFAVGARSTLTVTTERDYTFCVLSDDEVIFRIKGSRGWTVLGGASPKVLKDGFQTTATGSDIFAQVRLKPGTYPIEVMYLEKTGQANLAIWAASGRHERFDDFTKRYFSLLGSNITASESAAPFSLARSPGLTRPTNDDFAKAFTLSGRRIIVDANNTGSTLEVGEPTRGGTYVNSLWWKWTAPSSGLYKLSLSAPQLAWLAIYTGNTLATLTPVADEGTPNAAFGGYHDAEIFFTATSGATYYFQASAANSDPGFSEFPLRLRLRSGGALVAPANDNFANAIALDRNEESVTVSGEFETATTEPGDPSGSAIWFTWTPTLSGTYLIDTSGSEFATDLTVYTGSAVNALTQVDQYDDSGDTPLRGFAFHAIEDTTYRIAVGQQNNYEKGKYHLSLTSGILLFAPSSTDEDTPAESILLVNDNPTGHPHIGVTTNNPSLLPSDNVFFAGNRSIREFRFSPAANQNGTVNLSVSAEVDGMFVSASHTITVTPVNDAPSFSYTSTAILNSNISPRTIPNWARNISPGAANESSQTLNFVILSNSNPGLFSVPPAISADGTLTYTSVSGAIGNTVITFQLRDNGGTANGGKDASTVSTWNLTLFTPLSNWAGIYGLSGDAAAPAADPDSDGMDNLLEFVLGGDPTKMDDADLFLMGAIGPNSYTLSFTRSDDSEASANLIVQLSTDLVNWTDVPIYAEGNSQVSILENGAAPDAITVLVSFGSSARHFARVRATPK